MSSRKNLDDNRKKKNLLKLAAAGLQSLQVQNIITV